MNNWRSAGQAGSEAENRKEAFHSAGFLADTRKEHGLFTQ
jgi:hypothetical protein